MNETANRIKELRNRKGYSQEELAERSGLTSRTIQRIENGETEPRGDSLARLAEALGVTVDDLVDRDAIEDTKFIAAMNLSALSFLVFPLLGIIVPLAVWIFKKDKVKGLNDATRSLFNFQLTWILILIIGWVVLWPFLFLFSTVPSEPPSPLVSGILIGIFALAIIAVVWTYVFNVVMIIVNAVRAGRGEKVVYRPAIKFLGK